MKARLRALAGSELGERLALATITSGAIWGLGTLATFAVGVVLARRLGPAGYGVYGTAIALVALLSIPAQLGLPILATREIAATRARGGAGDVTALGWWFTVLVLTVSTLLAFALLLTKDVLPLAPSVRLAMPMAAALLPVLALCGLVAGLLRGQERVVSSQLLDVLIRPLAFLIALFAWSNPFGAVQGLTAQILATGTVALLGFTLFFRGLPLIGFSAAHRLRGWAAAALPMTLLETMRALEGAYPVLVASHAASIYDTGLLRVALASSVIVSLPISLQSMVTGPFLARAHADGKAQRLARIVAASTLFMSATVTGALLILAAVGRWALPFAFGSGFAAAYLPLMMLGGNQLLVALLGPGILLLSMTGEERMVARAFVASVIGAVIAALVFTPVFGVVGTAASMLVATAIRGYLLNRHARRMLGIDPSLWGSVRLLGSGSRMANGGARS